MSEDRGRILIIEDDPMLQMGIERMLQTYNQEVVGVAADGRSGVAMALELCPEIILMDLALPELDGVGATRQIKEALPNTKIIVLTSLTDRKQVLAAFASGADAYCVKGTNPEQLKVALSAVRHHSVYLDARVAQHLVSSDRGVPASDVPEFNFSQRELEVLQLLAAGKNNTEIGRELDLSPNTVKGHVRQIFAKLAVNDRVSAALKSWRLGLVEPQG